MTDDQKLILAIAAGIAMGITLVILIAPTVVMALCQLNQFLEEVCTQASYMLF